MWQFSFAAFLVVLLSTASLGFNVPIMRSAGRGSSSTAALRMMSSEEVAEPKPWVGAKKFSMKDRYEETVFSSDQISKILPHRYPFLLVDR
jgi:hypothetical protein